MHRRGVRRIFTAWVKTRRVCEWGPETGGWLSLEDNLRIEDSCLVTPLPVRALLDQQEADNAVVGALYAKGNPRLLSLLAEAEARGVAKGREYARITSEP